MPKKKLIEFIISTCTLIIIITLWMEYIGFKADPFITCLKDCIVIIPMGTIYTTYIGIRFKDYLDV